MAASVGRAARGGDEVEQRRAPRPPAGRMSQVAALYSWMWTFGSSDEREQVVGGVAASRGPAAPVVGQADLVHRAAVDAQRGHPVGDQHARLDRRARGDDRRPAAVVEPALGGELRADLAEQLGLQLGEVAARSGSCRRRCGAR